MFGKIFPDLQPFSLFPVLFSFFFSIPVSFFSFFLISAYISRIKTEYENSQTDCRVLRWKEIREISRHDAGSKTSLLFLTTFFSFCIFEDKGKKTSPVISRWDLGCWRSRSWVPVLLGSYALLHLRSFDPLKNFALRLIRSWAAKAAIPNFLRTCLDSLR